jgi:hypothetical protein
MVHVSPNPIAEGKVVSNKNVARIKPESLVEVRAAHSRGTD